MQYAEKGEELDPTELEDDTWITPKTTQIGLDSLDLQHKYRTAAPKPSKQCLNMPVPQHSSCKQRAHRSFHAGGLCRGCQANITKLYLTQTPNQPVEHSPRYAAVSTPDRIRAEAYRSLEVLRSQRYNMNLPVATYLPAPDDSIRREVYKAYMDETDHDLQAQLKKKNPDIPIVNAR
ncbi:hypothetical protein MRX96_021732 [Rhipicephalus microplus]